MRSRNPSPLRYPGGKSALAGTLEAILYGNGLQGGSFIEPFAGGAGAALKLLMGGHVQRIVINDVDRAIFSFWKAILKATDQFIEKVQNTPLTIDEWNRQREIYQSRGRVRFLDLGFATFFLNRCNRSGIVSTGGPIGGKKQLGEWKLDARFNRAKLIERIEEIASYEEQIVIRNDDAVDLLRNLDSTLGRGRRLIFADPPYYVKGRELYLNHFSEEAHLQLSKKLVKRKRQDWVLTYDDVPEVRKLYAGLDLTPYNLRYSAHLNSKSGGEIMITPPGMEVPDDAFEMLGRISARSDSTEN